MLRNSKGMTLLEISIILVIVGILSTMAIPMLGLTSRAKLKSAAREIVSNMQVARINALRDGNKWRVSFDADAKQYKLSYCPTTSCATAADYVIQKTVKLYDGGSNITFGSAKGNAPGSSCDDPGSGICLGSAGILTFTSGGTANAGSVYIKDSKTGDTIQIAVATTGRIHLRENLGTTWGD